MSLHFNKDNTAVREEWRSYDVYVFRPLWTLFHFCEFHLNLYGFVSPFFCCEIKGSVYTKTSKMFLISTIMQVLFLKSIRMTLMTH